MHSLYPKLARQEALILNVFDVLVHTKRQMPIEAVKIKGSWVSMRLPFMVFCPLRYSLDFSESETASIEVNLPADSVILGTIFFRIPRYRFISKVKKSFDFTKLCFNFEGVLKLHPSLQTYLG